jgi:hypothetical protein
MPQTGSFTAVAELEMSSFMGVAGFCPRYSDEEPPERGVWGYVVFAGSPSKIAF